jgi:hypothetical protein
MARHYLRGQRLPLSRRFLIRGKDQVAYIDAYSPSGMLPATLGGRDMLKMEWEWVLRVQEDPGRDDIYGCCLNLDQNRTSVIKITAPYQIRYPFPALRSCMLSCC